MKKCPAKILFVFILLNIVSEGYGQYNWKLSKDKDGMKVYESETKNSNFKSIKVEYTVAGTFDKLMAILNDVSLHKDWVYNSKKSYIISRNSPGDFYYYSETSIPWPMSNRDAVIHLTMTKDTLNRFLKITAIGVPGYLPEKSGKVRVPKLSVNWYVTFPSPNTLSIVYTLEADPGGSIPAWMVNSFADKGPFESFKKLATILKN